MADSRLCSIPECGKPVRRAGLCSAHHHRKLRHGDPLAGGPFRRKPQTECTVSGCPLPGFSLDLCRTHYIRLKKHGDPIAGSTYKGEVALFVFDTVASWESDDCLIWPFSCSGKNRDRPQFWLGQKKHNTARFICTNEYGEPPSPSHETAHSCGNSLCVNKKHIRWATHVENEADKIIHGTKPYGEAVGTTRLTASTVIEIRRLYPTLTQRELSRMFRTSQGNISRLIRRITWTQVD